MKEQPAAPLTTPAPDRLALATKAVTDEAGSMLCNWVDRGTERECWTESRRPCLCQAVAVAVLEAINV